LPAPTFFVKVALRFNAGEDFESGTNSETNFVGHGFMPCRQKVGAV